jgi:hypothetical protein
MHAAGWHGPNIAPQPRHVILVEPGRARDELRRFDQMRRATFVDVHVDVRMVRDDRAGCATVVEMDVRQQDGADVGHRDAVSRQPSLERSPGRRRPRVDEDHPVRPAEDGRGDDGGVVEEVKVNG